MTQAAEETNYESGDVIAAANGPVTNKVFLVKSGEVVLVPGDVPLPGEGQWGVGRRGGEVLAMREGLVGGLGD